MKFQKNIIHNISYKKIFFRGKSTTRRIIEDLYYLDENEVTK